MASVYNRVYSWCNDLRLRVNDHLALKKARRENPNSWSKEPLVSVLIPTYNRGRILSERTIPAILAQEYQNFEVIVVGDKVIDDTAERIRKIGDPRVRFHDLEKRGSYPSDPKLRWYVQGSFPRNKSHELLRGEAISCLSDDDVVLPNHLSSLVSHAQRTDAEFVCAAYEAMVHGERIRRGREAGIAALGFEYGGMPTWLYRSYLKCFAWNTQSWRKPWNRPCDYDLALRMKAEGVRFSYLDEVVVFLPAVEGKNTTGIASA